MTSTFEDNTIKILKAVKMNSTRFTSLLVFSVAPVSFSSWLSLPSLSV